MPRRLPEQVPAALLLRRAAACELLLEEFRALQYPLMECESAATLTAPALHCSRRARGGRHASRAGVGVRSCRCGYRVSPQVGPTRRRHARSDEAGVRGQRPVRGTGGRAGPPVPAGRPRGGSGQDRQGRPVRRQAQARKVCRKDAQARSGDRSGSAHGARSGRTSRSGRLPSRHRHAVAPEAPPSQMSISVRRVRRPEVEAETERREERP